MIQLVDVVNFNADASCLDSARWIRALRGGDDSEFCAWLRVYIEVGAKLVLGLTGATIADLQAHNPEALTLIRGHRDLFEQVARPFSHDVALVRGRHGFRLNLNLGLRAIAQGLSGASRVFLPPEFMLSNEQVAVLRESGIEAVFLNPARFAHETRDRLPNRPYRVCGVGGAELGCIPIAGEATQHYLAALHQFSATDWNAYFERFHGGLVFTWRDGESPFLIPDGIERERAWLVGERGIGRRLLREVSLDFAGPDQFFHYHLRAYPVHSFQDWMKEFRMIGYLRRLERMEYEIPHLSLTEQTLWLHAINSDVLSAVEKRSPVVRLRPREGAAGEFPHTIWRSERGFEGEAYLYALDALREGNRVPLDGLLASPDAHAVKFRGRLEFLRMIAEVDD